MAHARCVLTLRPDAYRSDAWIAYHAHLFGYENVTVIEADLSPDPSDGAVTLASGEYLVAVTENGLSCRRGWIEAALAAGDVEILGGFVALAEPCRFAVEGPIGTALTRLRFGPAPPTDATRVIFQGLGTMLEALGYADEWLGSPVRSVRGGADDATWIMPDDALTYRFKGASFRQTNPEIGAGPAFQYFIDRQRAGTVRA